MSFSIGATECPPLALRCAALVASDLASLRVTTSAGFLSVYNHRCTSPLFSLLPLLSHIANKCSDAREGDSYVERIRPTQVPASTLRPTSLRSLHAISLPSISRRVRAASRSTINPVRLSSLICCLYSLASPKSALLHVRASHAANTYGRLTLRRRNSARAFVVDPWCVPHRAALQGTRCPPFRLSLPH